jgi:hypothetical protein
VEAFFGALLAGIVVGARKREPASAIEAVKGFSFAFFIPAYFAIVGLQLDLIRGLVEYERLSHLVTATEASLRDALFESQPGAEALLAFEGESAIGFAVFFVLVWAGTGHGRCATASRTCAWRTSPPRTARRCTSIRGQRSAPRWRPTGGPYRAVRT